MTPLELARALADAARRSGQRGVWDAFVAGVRALDKPPVETKILSSPNLVCSGNRDQNPIEPESGLFVTIRPKLN